MWRAPFYLGAWGHITVHCTKHGCGGHFLVQTPETCYLLVHILRHTGQLERRRHMSGYTGSKNYCGGRFLIVLLTAVVFCGDTDDLTLVINDTPARIRENSVVLRHDIPYVSAAALEAQLGLTMKELVPDRQIGICREDRCIPYMLGDSPDMAWQENCAVYVPVGHLLDALGGSCRGAVGPGGHCPDSVNRLPAHGVVLRRRPHPRPAWS